MTRWTRANLCEVLVYVAVLASIVGFFWQLDRKVNYVFNNFATTMKVEEVDYEIKHLTEAFDRLGSDIYDVERAVDTIFEGVQFAYVESEGKLILKKPAKYQWTDAPSAP